MQFLESFRHFLFPFDQEVLETTAALEEPVQNANTVAKDMEERSQESQEFIVSNSFLYLNNL